jgi:hypothetical protein
MMTTPGAQSLYPTEDEVNRIAAIQDPAARNLQITQAYWELSAELERRINGHANWCTFATWASQQAGITIRHQDLPDLLRQRLQKSWKIIGLDLKLLQLLAEDNIDLLQVVIDSVTELGPLRRPSDFVGKGNNKVFAEIAPLFARLLARFPDISAITDAQMDDFCQGIKPGPPPAGQDTLKQAFQHYRAAAQARDSSEKAQLMLLANLQIGFHEQMRLQPEIEGALNGALFKPGDLADLLVQKLTGHEGRIAKAVEKLWRSHDAPLRNLANLLATDVEKQIRMLITDLLMTLWLPPHVVLRLGHDLTQRYPEILQTISNPGVLKTLVGFGADSGTPLGSRAMDWANFTQRMRFIAALFRAYAVDKNLFDPVPNTGLAGAAEMVN